jgi:hypothetical protein
VLDGESAILFFKTAGLNRREWSFVPAGADWGLVRTKNQRTRARVKEEDNGRKRLKKRFDH